MFKKVGLIALIALIVILTIGASFKNKTWKTAEVEFPYVGAYFCHNDDYVRFYCTGEMHRFYYMTAKVSDAYVEMYIDGKPQGVVLKLPVNTWNGKHFAASDCNWKAFDLGQGYIGHIIEIHFRENVTVGGVKCPENDIMIKLEDNNYALLWKNVDSDGYCDLDRVANK